MRFADRADAGKRLARRLVGLSGEQTIVLGLPRGGVPVAFEVAAALDAPLDIIVVRKLGVPFQPELAMGALGEDGVRVLNDSVIRLCEVSPDEIEAAEVRELAELERRARRFRSQHPRLALAGRTALVIDDGIATGATARAACQVARAQGAARVVLAVPVATPSAAIDLQRDADEVICLTMPETFHAVGQFYDDFSQTSDDEVLALLARSAARTHHGAVEDAAPSAAAPPLRDEEVEVEAGGVRLAAHLRLPERAKGLVVFAHGSGSSRHSPRNRHVAAMLDDAGLGTLLLDLLTPSEEGDRGNVFDIELLGARLLGVVDWLRAQPATRGLPIGYFGASTGAGAALWAAAAPQADIAAVVSRGGRPDLAGPRLAKVRAPTLLVVGGHDELVLDLNRGAQAELRCENRLAIVPGATHLFEEPGALDSAARLARDWFLTHLSPRQASPSTGEARTAAPTR